MDSLELENLHPKYVTFMATADESAFPRDMGTLPSSYEIIAWHHERMSFNDRHEFNPHLMIYIPEGYVGSIQINDNDTEISSIDIDERCLGGGKWHNLRFTVKYIGQISSKIDGARGLAKLTLNKCE